MRTVIVRKRDVFRDGGTIEYQDENGVQYFVDRRIRTKTPGAIYDRYPDDDGAKILHNIVLATKV